MFYTITMPWFVRKMYPTLTWEKTTDQKKMYLTFDDGPHPTATPFVLDTLAQYNAKATFFCIGKNVVSYPEIYKRIIAEGHEVGNHTYNHLNGWKTANEQYFQDIFEAAKYIDSSLFRPPYGRINKFQVQLLQKENNANQHGAFRIIMWSVLSGDFDVKLSPEKCLSHVILKAKPGSIVVFHDSTKAWDRMSYALPHVLEHFSKAGYQFCALER